MSKKRLSGPAGRIALLAVGIAPFVALSVACGAAPTPAKVSPGAGRPAPAPAHAQPDLSPVAEPETLVLLARWQNPAASIATVSRWTGLPIGASTLATAVGGELAEALADDAPVDVALMLDPQANTTPEAEPWGAISAPLKSLDALRHVLRAGGDLTEVEPAIYRLGPSNRDAGDASCYVAPAVGKAQTRLVCGRRDKDVRALLPFLTRTLPDRKCAGGDAHVEVRIPVLQKAYGVEMTQALRAGAVMMPRKFSIGEPTFDRALERAATALAEEASTLAKDVDLVTLDLDLREQSGDLTTAIRFRGHDSWWAGTLAGAVQRQGPAPGAFFRLPKSATAATFFQASDPSRQTGFVVLLGELLDGWLRHEGVADADRSHVTQVLSPNRITGAAFVAAAGDLGSGAAAGGSTSDTATSAVRANAPPKPGAGLELSPGRYWILRIEDPKQPMQILRDLTDALNRPAIKKLLEGKLQSQAPLAAIAFRSVPAPTGLPKASLDLEISTRWTTGAVVTEPVGVAKAKDAKAQQKSTAQPAKAITQSVHLLAMPDDGATWLAFGADQSVLSRVLLATRNPNADDRIKGDPELARLETEKLAGGGYFTLKTLASPVVDGSLAHRRPVFGEAARMLDLTPHRGATPIPYTVTVSNDGALTLTGTVHLPKAAIEDLAVAIGSSLANRLGRF